jgi:nicotinic acid mononucleotide adenylyltransferase
MKQQGVVNGRQCPTHLGHEAIIRAMIEECGAKNSLIIIGSSQPTLNSYHSFFPYEDRRRFILRIFPEMKGRIVPLCDFPSDEVWMTALDDVLTACGYDPQSALFYSGSQEDAQFYSQVGKQCRIMNRFDGTTPKISGTQVRDALFERRSIADMVNPLILDDVEKTYARLWAEFKKR